MAQFEPDIPCPLRHDLPGFLPPGRVATPTIGLLLLVFVRERRLKSAAMQIQFDDIRRSERLLWQVREEEFVDDARTRDTHWALFFGSWMGGHRHAAQHSRRPHRDLRAVIE